MITYGCMHAPVNRESLRLIIRDSEDLGKVARFSLSPACHVTPTAVLNAINLQDVTNREMLPTHFMCVNGHAQSL